MKNFLVRILLAAGLTLVGFALASSAQAQQADEDPAPAAPRQQQSTATPKSPQQPEVPAPLLRLTPKLNRPSLSPAASRTNRVSLCYRIP